MESVYVLIKTDSTSMEEVAASLMALERVSRVDAVTGVYDIIAIVEGEYVTDALNTVVKEVRKIKGVTSTETLVVMNT